MNILYTLYSESLFIVFQRIHIVPEWKLQASQKYYVIHIFQILKVLQ